MGSEASIFVNFFIFIFWFIHFLKIVWNFNLKDIEKSISSLQIYYSFFNIIFDVFWLKRITNKCSMFNFLKFCVWIREIRWLCRFYNKMLFFISWIENSQYKRYIYLDLKNTNHLSQFFYHLQELKEENFCGFFFVISHRNEFSLGILACL